MSAEFLVIVFVGGFPIIAAIAMMYIVDRDARRRAGR